MILKPQKRNAHCICYWIFSAGEGNVWHTALRLKAVFSIHSVCLANSPFHGNNCCNFNKRWGTKRQSLVWQPKRGTWCSFIPHQLSLSLFAAPCHSCWSPCHSCCSPYRTASSAWQTLFWVSSRCHSVGKMEEMEKLRKGIFQPHAASFLQLSLHLCLFYIISILAACLI